jgi:putative DNA primase/helicase
VPVKTPIADAASIKRAVAIWYHASDPRGTVVERYLNSRALNLPNDIVGRVVRYSAECPWGEGETIYVPAMIVLVRDIATNEPVGIQKTRLTPEGLKVERWSQGITRAGAIKIDPDATVEQAHALAIGEGFETSLSGRQKGFRPTWAAISKGGITKLPILEAVKVLHIFAENDANSASEIAVTQCFHRWKATGRKVIVVSPEPEFNDLNDELKREAGL